jgi:hypothetical protein
MIRATAPPPDKGAVAVVALGSATVSLVVAPQVQSRLRLCCAVTPNQLRAGCSGRRNSSTMLTYSPYQIPVARDPLSCHKLPPIFTYLCPIAGLIAFVVGTVQ